MFQSKFPWFQDSMDEAIHIAHENPKINKTQIKDSEASGLTPQRGGCENLYIIGFIMFYPLIICEQINMYLQSRNDVTPSHGFTRPKSVSHHPASCGKSIAVPFVPLYIKGL